MGDTIGAVFCSISGYPVVNMNHPIMPWTAELCSISSNEIS